MNENFYQRAENLKDGEFNTKQKAWKSQVVILSWKKVFIFSWPQINLKEHIKVELHFFKSKK